MKYILLLSGKINSGKNQYAEYLKEAFEAKGLNVKQDLYAKDLKDFSVTDFKTLGMALQSQVDTIKANIGVYFDLSDRVSIDAQQSILDSLTELTFKDYNFYEDKTLITRTLLQLYGTDIARKRFDDQFWIKKLAERINNDTESDVIIITDVRFQNELEDIHDFVDDCRIVPIRIERDLNRNTFTNEHPSETALDDYGFWEFIVDNNATLKDLKDSSIVVSEDILMPD